MKTVHLLLLSLFLVFTACHKDEYTPPANYMGDRSIMQGQVTDPWGMPIAGAEVSWKVLAEITFTYKIKSKYSHIILITKSSLKPRIIRRSVTSKY